MASVVKRKCSKFVEVNYKDCNLSDYISDSGKKIIPRRVTGVSASSQRKISKSIKLARYLALLPYCDKHNIIQN